MGTQVTIELDDQHITWLRAGYRAAAPGTTPWEIGERLAAALPPEPVKVTVELPVTLAEKIRSGRFVVSQDKDDSAVDLWRLVERALKAREFEEAMAEGVEHVRRAGMPLA